MGKPRTVRQLGHDLYLLWRNGTYWDEHGMLQMHVGVAEKGNALVERIRKLKGA